MNKQNVIKTQNMWKNYDNAKYWIETISNPSKHIYILKGKIVGVDDDYIKAIESLSYLLLAKQNDVNIENE